MQVKPDSPVNKEAQPYLYSWDSSAREYFSFFEAHKSIAAHNLVVLKENPFTKWRDLI